MLKQMKKTAFSISIVSTVSVCMITLSILSVKFSTVFYILICGFVGLFIYFLQSLRKRKKEDKGV